MFGWSLDDSRDDPVGTPGTREAAAIHWHWTSDATHDEIADALGVTPKTVREYVHSEPSEEVREQLTGMRTRVRVAAVEELKRQLREAGQESRTKSTPVEIWTDDDGNLCVQDKRNEDGEVVDRYPVPQGYELGPDSTGRFYRREEVREILDLLTDIVGAKAPERMEVDAEVEHSGDVDVDLDVDPHVVDAVRDAAETNLSGGSTDDE